MSHIVRDTYEFVGIRRDRLQPSLMSLMDIFREKLWFQYRKYIINHKVDTNTAVAKFRVDAGLGCTNHSARKKVCHVVNIAVSNRDWVVTQMFTANTKQPGCRKLTGITKVPRSFRLKKINGL